MLMKNNFLSLVTKMPQNTGGVICKLNALPLRYLCAMLFALFVGVGQMWGANGDVLFTQDFNSATAVSQNLGAAAVDIDKESGNNIFGVTYTNSQFTSLKAAKISNAKGGIAINSKVTSNSVEYDYGKKFGFRSDDTKASFHLVKTTNFASTAPTALKVEMNMYYKQLSSGSNVTASFAIGEGFSDKEKPTNSNIHSGFTIKGNGTATFCQFGTTTNLTGYATAMTQNADVKMTWVINHSGGVLKYTDPNGEESSLANNAFDVWVGTTKNVSGAPATTGTKALQNLYIGDCDAKKKFEFYLDDIKVTDLTPCAAPSITTQPIGASLAIGDANPELSVSANNTTSYAWKESSDGTSHDGSSTLASTASFTPEVNDAVQTKYYYCELVNSCNASNVVKTNIVTVEVVSSITPVTGVSLDITSQVFTLGGTIDATLTATVAPNEATNKNISWESDKPLIVSVTDNGDGTADIKGLAEGTATITVTTQDGSFTATCNVTVNPDPCHTYFWFSKAADATTAGVTNNEGSFFTTSASGSNGATSSITIDGVEYAITNKSSNIGNSDAVIVSFTVPADKAGTFYTNLGSSGNSGAGSSRTLYLKKGGVAVVTATDAIYGDGAQHNATIENIPTGTYTLHANNNVRVGMFALKACDADYHTITLDLDGGTGATSIAALDGVPAYKPADPTKAHHRFDGWYNGETPYDWTANVTGDLTLTAHWTQLYTISFAAGEGGSGDAPAAVADKAQGETFTVPANTFTAPTNKEFDIWNDGSADYAPGATYTVGTANVVLTAQWKALQDKYTVIFKDGDVTLGTKQFDVASNPSDADIDKTKSLFTFAAWQKDAADIALDAAFWATVAKDAEITLTARWAAAYALDVNFKDAATQALGVETALNTYHYASDASDISFEAKGLKIKTNAARFYFNVAPGKVAEIKFGDISGATYSVDGGAAETLSASQLKATYSASAQSCVMTMTTAAYNIVENVVIHDPYEVSYDADGGDPVAAQYGEPSVTLPLPVKGTESFIGWFDGETKVGEAGDKYTPTANITLKAHWEAISTDARLASITFSSDAGTLSPAFDPEVTSYTYTMPYGTAAIPTITGATSVNANAKDPVIDAQAANWNDVAHIHGVAESDDTKDYYITMKIAPKDGTSIFKAELTSPTAATYSGLYVDDENSQIALSNDGGKYKFAGTSNFIKMALTGGTFATNDKLTMTYSANPQQGELAIYDNTDKVAGTAFENNTLDFPAGANGLSTLYIRRTDANNFNGWVLVAEVTRVINPVLKAITFAGVDATVNEGAKTVTVTVPNATDLGTMVVVPTIFRNAPHATTPEAVTTNGGEWVEGSGNTYRIMDKDGDYTDYTVTITRAAVSHDATLSALTVDGNAVALEDGVYTYAYEYETGTAVSPAPVVAATAHDANAKSVEITQASDKKGTATVVVTAEDNSTTQTYTINFSISTKIKVVIFDGNDAKATAIKGSPHATGASWVVADLSADDDDKGTSYATKVATGGATGASKNIAVTIPVNFKPYFEIAQATNKNGTERTAFITTTANGSGTKLYELANSVTNTPTKGMSAGLTEETTYYIHSNASINFYEVILYLEPLAPKAATPTLSGLANLAACTLGTDELTVTASDLDGGTAHYQWYKVVEGDDPDEAVGTDANIYAPAVAGNYYVVVTNQKDGCRDNSKKSDEVTVSVKTHTEITVAPLNQRATVGNNATLSVTAIGDGILHYTWYTCDDELGTNPVAVDPANDAATYEVTVTAAMNQWYKVTVHSDCGEDQSATAKVSEFVPATPANVTESIVWDWKSTTAGFPTASNSHLDFANTSVEELFADVDAAMPNNAEFRSDMLYGIGQYAWRNKSDGEWGFQGFQIRFNTEVAGRVRVYFRAPSSGQTSVVTINGRQAGSRGNSWGWSEYVDVEANTNVIIAMTNGETGMTRVQKIEFQTLAHRRTAAYSVGELGTICLEDDAIAVGANVYELQGHDENGKMVFEQIESGEIEAGKPYLFQATNASQVSFYKQVNATHADGAGSWKGMYGTFVDKPLYPTTDVDMFYFSGTHIWAVKDFTVASITIPAYRCYVNYAEFMENPVSSSTPLPGRKRMLIGVNGAPAVATGVENAAATDKPAKMLINGQLFILRGEKMYDAKGQLVK